MRLASCRCGGLAAKCDGEPVRVSVCHCLDCQRRSGSAFAAQARFPRDQVTISGKPLRFDHIADSGNRTTSMFCHTCGSTIAYQNEGMEGLIAIPIGAFADPDFPPPHYSVWEERKHRWVDISGDGIDHQN